MVPLLPLQQSPIFAGALRRLGRDVALVERPGQPPLVTLRRFGFTFAPRAFGDPCGATLVDAEAPGRPGGGYVQLLTAAHVAEMDLSGPVEARRARMAGKARNRLRRAEERVRAGFRPFRAERDNWLLDAEAAQRRRVGYRALPLALVPAMAETMPGAVILGSAQEHGLVVSAALFVLHGPVATYHIGWSSSEGMKAHAQTALMIAAADWLAGRGVVRLDLGLIDSESGAGLSRFKLGLGAVARPLGGTWMRLPGAP